MTITKGMDKEKVVPITMEFYSTIKKMKFALKCVELKNMILNKIIQAQNDKYQIIFKTQVLASNFNTCIYVGVCIEPRKLKRDP